MPRVVDDLGTEVLVPREPRRLVSLVPNVSEALWAWGLADRVVGVTDWCVSPPRGFPRADRVRGTKNPDVAAIAALAPDLVLANEEENREIDVRRLRERGMAVHVTRVRTVSDAAAALGAVGEVVGAHRPASRLAGELRWLAHVAGEPRDGVLTLCPIWREPWMVVGPDTFAGSLLAAAGANVWHPPAGRRYPVVELEDARRAGVGLVLLPDEPYAFSDADREAFAGFGAPVHLIDGAGLTWWGPRTPAAWRALSELVATGAGADPWAAGHRGRDR